MLCVFCLVFLRIITGHLVFSFVLTGGCDFFGFVHNPLQNDPFTKHEIKSCKLFFVIFLNREACSHNIWARLKGIFFGLLGVLLPFVLLVNFLASSNARETLYGLVAKERAEKLFIYTVSTVSFFV